MIISNLLLVGNALSVDRPNVVLILADDLGYGDLGCYGATNISTPNLDQMAGAGSRFTDFHVAAPLCSPSRAALLTGCYPLRVGVPGGIGSQSSSGLAVDREVLSELLRRAGYRTAMFGKWHLGHQTQFLPSQRGFEEWFGTPASNDTAHENRDPAFGKVGRGLLMFEGNQVIEIDPDQSQLTTRYAQRAVQFIDRNSTNAFFLYVAFNAPHTPLFVSDKFRGKSARGLYGDVVMELDWAVGKVLAALDRHKLAERTFVIFTSDNGPWLIFGDHGGSAGPWRGGKKQTFEGGVRVPCLMRWPGQIPAGRVCNELVTAMDILPTLTRVTGCELPGQEIDGMDVWPVVSGTPETHARRETFYYYWQKELHAVRRGPWKLQLPHLDTQAPDPDRIGYGGVRGKIMTVKRDLSLFDLVSDVGETTSLTNQHADIVEALQKAAEIVRADWGDSISPANTNAPRTQSMDLGTRRQLFLDTHLVESMDNLRLVLHRPQAQEVVLTLDAAWEGPESAYVTVMPDDETLRLYYRGGGEKTEEVTCLATSLDGIHWTKPDLGLYEFKGSRHNNIIYRGQRKAYWESHNFTPFKDANPATLPEARYKAVALGRHRKPDGETVKALVALRSADGIHWQRLRDEPIITQGSFDSQNVAFWDMARREYVCFFRDGRPSPDGGRVRSVLRTTSSDFLHWTDPMWLDFGPAPLEHFYVNTIAPYFREPTMYLGFPMRFVPERKTIGRGAQPIDGVSDAVLISSRDGLRFARTFREAFIRPGIDPRNWGHAHGNNTPAWGLVATSPTEISIYWAEHYGGIPQLRRGTLRPDGFVSLTAPADGGTLITRPVRSTGGRLHLNYSTSAIGSLRAEIQDANGQALPGFSLGDCPDIYGDEIDRPVAWKGKFDLSHLAGEVIRLRFVLKDADLFSFQFVREQPVK